MNSASLTSRDLRFWDPLGGKQRFSIQTYFQFLSHPKFWVFAGLSMLLFFGTDPSGNRDYVPLWASFAIWPVAYVQYMSLYLIAFALQSVVTQHWTRLRVPTPLIGFFALMPTVYVSEAVILNWISGGIYPQDLRGKYLFYFLSVQVIEAVFFKYVFPYIRNDLNRENAKPDSRHVIIGGERIKLDKIRLIEACEHHVQITMVDAEARLRARLGDIVAQTRPEDGVQPHRSWWVSRDAAVKLCNEGGKLVLRLDCDRPIPVARTRIDHVQAWAQQHLPVPTEPRL